MNRKTPKTIIVIAAMVALIIPYCQSQDQDIEFRHELRPKSKEKLASLYPHASINTIIYYKSDKTEKFDINCHCAETEGMIILIIDTNGNLLNEEAHHDDLKGLPDTIKNYMKKNTAANRRFLDDYYIKRINNKGEIRYGIMMIEFQTGYMLWFKSSGEFITREVDEGLGG